MKYKFWWTIAGYTLTSTTNVIGGGQVTSNPSQQRTISQSTSITTVVTLNSQHGQIAMYPYLWTSGDVCWL